MIYLASFGGVSEARVQLVQRVIGQFYGLPVRRLPTQRLAAAVQCPVRSRPRAAMVLEQLQALLPDSTNGKIIGLTTQDVEIKNRRQPHWGVMGLANDIGGDACVVSTFRLAGKTNRLRKVSLHEIGHLMNLPHCTAGTAYCFMNDARGRGAVVDRTQERLCPACRARMEW
ncbi:archaemetzincin [Hymenobacter sp. CRA2]|uniref:archaemetzincin n=1 Tax=Hymenobacter sp. CRA2 TaxID=1955620 RepID=UPI001590717C|nr:archaemetzincin [Hymenobacter sp. CRA2]